VPAFETSKARAYVSIFFSLGLFPTVVFRVVPVGNMTCKPATTKITTNPFGLYRATLCVSAVFDVARFLSVCVCPSVTLLDYIRVAEVIIKLLSRPGGTTIVVFFDPKRRYPIPRGTPSAGAQNTGGLENFAISTEIAVSDFD